MSEMKRFYTKDVASAGFGQPQRATASTCPVCKGRLHAAQEGHRHFLMCIVCNQEVDLTPMESQQPNVERAWQNDHSPREFKNEEAFLQGVKTAAKERGWTKFYHTRKSQRSDPGWPDVVLARPGRVIFAELKMPKNYPTVEQKEWLEALSAGKEVYLWYPRQWQEIMEVLEK